MNKFLLMTLIFSFSLTLVSAAPPITEVSLNFEQGYRISPQLVDTISQNRDFTINFFLYNSSNGVLISNSSTQCIVYLANQQGVLIDQGNADYAASGDYWNYKFDSGNFSSIQQYNLGISCNSSTQGGSSVQEFRTISGKGESSLIFVLLMVIFSFTLLIIGLITKDPPMTIIGGFAVSLVGLYTLNNGMGDYRTNLTQWISILIMVFGGFWSVKAAMEGYLKGW